MFSLQAGLLIYLVLRGGLKAYQDNLERFIGLLLSFGLAHLNFSYFMSFFFRNPQTALKAFAFIYLVGGFFSPFLFTIYIYSNYGCTSYHVCEIIFQLIPIQTLFSGIHNFIKTNHSSYLEFEKKFNEGAID